MQRTIFSGFLGINDHNAHDRFHACQCGTWELDDNEHIDILTTLSQPDWIRVIIVVYAPAFC